MRSAVVVLSALLACVPVTAKERDPAVVGKLKSLQSFGIPVDEAQRLAAQLWEHLRKEPDPPLERKLITVECFWYVDEWAKSLDDAVAFAARARERQGPTKDEDYGQVRNCEAQALSRAGQHDKAREVLRSVIDDPASTQFPRAVGQAYSLLGDNLQNVGRYSDALQVLLRAHAMAVANKSEVSVVKALERLGAVYSGMGVYDKAIDYFEQARRGHEQAGDGPGAIIATYNIGRALERKGAAREAYNWYQRGLDQARRIANAEMIAVGQTLMGSVMSELGQPEQAFAWLDPAQAYWRRVNDGDELARVERSLGTAHAGVGRHAQAVEAFDRAIAWFTKEKDLKSLAGLHLARAASLAQLGRWQEAYGDQVAAADFGRQIAAREREFTDSRLRIEFDTAQKERENALLQREKAVLSESDAAKSRELQRAAELRQVQLAAIVAGALLIAALAAQFFRLRRQKARVERGLADLQRAQEQLVLSEKMASIGTLTAGVAHEINNPANFAHVGAQSLGADIERFREFLLTLVGDGEFEVKQALNERVDNLARQTTTIVDGTTRIRDLVTDLRSFSRLGEADRKAVRLSEGLVSTIRLVQPRFADVACIECRLDADPLVDCWPALLNQVFMNVLVNACQAIQACRERDGSTEPGTVRVSDRVIGGWVELDVEDDGCGMPPEVQARLFEPFYTTKGVGEGTGLGMSISFGIMQRHGGGISVRSQVGKGSCVTLRLRLEAAPEAAPA